MLIQNGFMVDVYDCPFMNISYEQLLEYLKNNKYDAVGLSTYYFNSNDVLRISEYIKSLNDQIFVFIGGYLPTQYYEKMDRYFSFIDCMVIGEGELTSLRLLRNFKNGKWKNSKGIAYLDENKIRYTGNCDPVNHLDILPFPYRVPRAKEFPIATVLTSRGCYGNCNYCSIQQMIKASNCKRLRKRSPENVIDEIKQLEDNENKKTILFADDNFSLRSKNDKIWFDNFSQLIIKHNIDVDFFCEIRADDIVYCEEYIEKFKKIGLKSIFIGIENFVQKHLDFYNKNITVETNLKALQTLESLQIAYSFGFMLFNPIITIKDIFDNIIVLEQIYKNNKYLFPDRLISNSAAIAYPGTSFEDFIVKNDLQLNKEEGYRIIDEKAFLCKKAANIWGKLAQRYFSLAANINDVSIRQKWSLEILKLDIQFLYHISNLINENKIVSIPEITPIINEQHGYLVTLKNKLGLNSF